MWTPTGIATADFAPALTGPTGIFLRGTASYQNAGSTISVTSDPVYYISDNDLSDAMSGTSGNNIIFGNGGDDVIAAGIGSLLAYGGDGNDTFVATVGDGVATFDGQAGVNTVDMSQLSAAATVNLVTGKATSAQTAAATLVSIQNVVSGLGNDTITGDANNNVFFAAAGGDGNDSYTGGGGSDTYDLSLTAAGTTVNLGAGTATGADTGTDTLVGITNVVGSAGNDRFVAAVGDGNNSYNGGLGTDTYDLSATTAAATVNLATGVSTSADTGSDTLAGIENVIGGAGADTITGDTNDNVLTGGAGNDTMVGGGGNDTFIGGTGANSMTGATGNDTYFVDDVGDVVVELANQGTDTINTTLNTFSLFPPPAALGNVENLTFSGVGAFTGTGNGLANVITGGAGNDTLNGSTGADTMLGGLGNDTYFVDNLLDVVTEAPGLGTGTDTVRANASYTLAPGSAIEILSANTSVGLTLIGNEFDNTVVGGGGADTLNGGDGNDRLNGGAGNDTVAGGLGNDTFVATVGDGNDSYDGGAGTDVYDLSNTSAAAIVNLGLGTSASAQTGTDSLTGIENVVGSTGNDTFVASANDGNNSYNGGAGIDTYDLSATSANATVNLALATAQLISTQAGTDTLTQIENVTGGTGSDTLTGTGANNVLTGGGGNDTLNGGAGADTMIGGIGNDTYVVDNNGDVVTENAGEGVDIINTTLGTYSLAALVNVENLTFTGAGSFNGTGNTLDNTIIGGASNDTLTGGAGNDTLNGLGGTDTMIGGAGNDTYFVDNANDVVNETAGQGSDTVWASTNYTLSATSEIEFLNANALGNLTLTGNALNNTITASVGADTLIGGGGNDVLVSGTGNDRLTGGTVTPLADGGNDIFKFLAKGFGQDVITDFTAHAGLVANKDQMDISGLGITAGASFTNNVHIAASAGGATTITFTGSTDSIRLLNTAPGSLTQADFILA